MAFELVLAVLSTLFFFGAIYFSFALSKETGGDKYWVFLLIASVAFTVSHLSSKGFLPLSLENGFVLKEAGEVVGAFSLAYATYGLWSSMKKIRERVGKDL